MSTRQSKMQPCIHPLTLQQQGSPVKCRLGLHTTPCALHAALWLLSCRCLAGRQMLRRSWMEYRLGLNSLPLVLPACKACQLRLSS